MRALAGMMLSLVSGLAMAATPYELRSLTLLQPDEVLTARVPSAQLLAEYVKRVQAAIASTLADVSPSPSGGQVVLAVRPGAQSKAWLALSPALSPALERRVVAAIEAVPPFAAKEGVVVFAMDSSFWGGAMPSDKQMPAEWRKAAERHVEPLETGELVDLVWPGASTPR